MPPTTDPSAPSDTPLAPMPAAPVLPTPTRAAFAFVFVTVVLDMLALGVMVPVLPTLVKQFEGGDSASAARITGVFGFAWALMQFVAGPVLGALSDRFGRRPVILLSNFGMACDYVLMACAPSVRWLFVGRLVSGITAATFSTAGAYIADVTPPDKRAARFGMLGAGFGLGFIIGPAVGGWLGQYNLRAPFWAAAALSFTNVAYGFFVLPESLPQARRVPFSWRRANPAGAVSALGSNRQVFGLSQALFFYYLAHESLPSMFVLYTSYRYAWDARTVGFVLATVGVTSTVVQGFLVGRAVKSLGERGALRLGLMAGIIGFAMYGLATVTAVVVAGVFLQALMGLSGPSMQSLMSRSVDPKRQGELQGAISSMRGISGMIGPLLFTQTFALAIGPFAYLNAPGAPYLVAAMLVVLSLARVTWMERA